MLSLLTFLLFAAPGGDAVVLRAGTIHLVHDGQVLTDSAILVEDGKIVAIGADLKTPLGVREVDYGSDATIVPGFVAADSPYGAGGSAERSAAPMLRAIDNFDPYSRYTSALSGGVTTCYLNPGVDRLIAGLGGVVKMKGNGSENYLLLGASSIQGSISSSARNTTAFWEPPLPATVDVGLGVAQPQLPHSTMGAIVGLQELFDFAGGDQSQESEWGAAAGPALAGVISEGLGWRMAVDDSRQTTALLDFFGGVSQPLVLEGNAGFVDVADELGAAGVSVIFKPGESTSSGGSVRIILGGGAAFFMSSGVPGGEDAKAGLGLQWRSASKLMEAGVTVAVATPRGKPISELLLRTSLARRGGMSEENALRAITLNAAEILGVADRVGSLVVGKDADFAVLSGAPINHETRVLATWVDGELAWETSKYSATIIAVDELHLGDGIVLTPGEVLMQSGRIVEVGRHVARPAGAKVVRGAAAMPGAIDGWGQLGLEGSSRGFSTSFDLSRIVGPGSDEDQRVAAAGVTTVNMAPKSASHGTPFMPYKPVGTNPGSMVLRNPAGMRLVWDNPIPSMAGASVRATLGKAVEYKKKWEEYEAKLAAWTPPAPEAADEEDEDEAEKGEGEGEGDEDKKKKKPKKKPDAISSTGTWEADGARLRLIETEGSLEGYLRLDGVDDLITLTGSREEYVATLNGEAGTSPISLTLTQEFEDNFVDQARFEGTYTIGATEPVEVNWSRTGTDYPMASMPERRKVVEAKAPKGTPKSPGINPGLEPIRQAMLGNSMVLVNINNGEQLGTCLAVFKQYGIRPVLEGRARPSSSQAGLISGVLLGSASATPPPAGIPFMVRTNAEGDAAQLLDDIAIAVGKGLSPSSAVRGLTGYPAEMLGISHRVGLLKAGRDADLILFDGPPLLPSSQVLKVWVSGKEVSR